MTKVVFKKIGELIAVLFVVSLGTFGLVSLIPGDPSVAALGEGRTPEEYAQARLDMGLDDPF
ncbi:MAG: ABC transporter permease, partial [Rhodococcus sp. (in: high G+C Gram-positive bacteria)]